MSRARWTAFRRMDRRLALGIALSVLVHALLLLMMAIREPPPDEEPRREAVRLRVLDRAEQAARSGQRQKDSADGQVVDLPRPEREQVPDEARFLSRWDIKAERERKAKRQPAGRAGSPGAVAKAVPAPIPDALPGPEPAPAPEGPPDQAAAQPPSKQPPPAGPGSGRRALAGLNRLLVPTLGGGRAAARGAAATGGGGGGEVGGMISADAFLGVPEEGDANLVNSRSFKYWDFFHRVKERVRQEWTPGPAYEGRDPYGKVYGPRDRLTVLAVHLDAQGVVQRLQVVRESGLPFLDEEALRAFRSAGPFPNPPSGLVDEDGRIAFTFGFLLEVGSSKGSFFWQRPD